MFSLSFLLLLLEALLKLPQSSPAPLVYFISGTLPATAILHLRQLCLFGMISRLHGDPLQQHAQQVLLSHPPSSKSWFIQIRNICLQYSLPHPLTILQKPFTKEVFKKLTKSKVTDFWEEKLRRESSFLPSLHYLCPEFLSLSTPHRILTCAGQKAYEVAKARIQLLFLANKYPCNQYTRHWSPHNPHGHCTFQPCADNLKVESPEHILLHCPEYATIREKLLSLCINTKSQVCHETLSKIFSSGSKTIMQFLTDCSVLPEVIKMAQLYGEELYNDLFYLSRTWCFSHHKQRMIKLGKWNFR